MLSNQVKTFIVKQLALYQSPSEVAAAVAHEFGVSVTLQQVSKYNPDNHTAINLAADLKALFYQTRRAFLADAAKIAVSHQSYRLRQLDAALQRQLAKPNKNEQLILQILEHAAKEAGGMFTNRRELTGKNGDAIRHEHTNRTEIIEREAMRLAQLHGTTVDFERAELTKIINHHENSIH